MIYGYKYNTGYIKLKRVLSERGIMQYQIAGDIGLSMQTFNKKLNRNKTHFTDMEKLKIREVLNYWDGDLFCFMGTDGKIKYPGGDEL